MPVDVHANPRHTDEREFAETVYRAMASVFAIHNEFGRFFDEAIYKRELARRLPGVELEVPVDVQFEPFHKRYFLDVLVVDCAVLEFKSVATLSDRHRSQLLQYLMLCDLPHGKLINVRTESVEHEFVNCTLKRIDRTQFHVDRSAWKEIGDKEFMDWFERLLRDLGTGLDVSLYEEAATQFLSGTESVERDADVISAGAVIGRQRFRQFGPDVALKITTLSQRLDAFETHACKLLTHTSLQAIQWINISRDEVLFKTLLR